MGRRAAAISVESPSVPSAIEHLQTLVADATRHDGVSPLNEQAVLALRAGGTPQARHIVARDGSDLVGYGLLQTTDRSPGGTGEVVVAPAHRRRGIGTAVVRAMLGQVAPAPLRLWAHGNLPAAGRLAAALGFDRVRDLWQMRLDLTTTALQPPRLPRGVSVRTFRPGHDEGAWLAVNARAFASHPEQGALALDALKARMAEPWFDPDGFFLAESAGRLVGFHWTKIHPSRAGRPPVGEVYVVGVDPSAQGAGLGRALTGVGLEHLRGRGAERVILYVEADNTAAIRTYRGLGFVHSCTDVMYCRSTGAE